MAKFCAFFLILLWFSYLLISSILLFTRGFLLTRDVQSNVSTCISHKDIESHDVNSLLKKSSDVRVCLEPQAKVVWLIIDALRYDFLLYNDSNPSPLPYENKMPVITKLIREHPNNTRIFKFIADPPTTTMQRLKALTTGSLPTFIDAGSNFATQEILEDNIIDKVVSHKYAAVFAGDDTWTSLYPDKFLRSYPYPSFDVWDLDTVDNGVRKQIFSELEKKDWNLLIGHMLGVDHCGHRYGPNHVEMKRKLGEMNDIVGKIVAALPEDSILFVVGDHGMTLTGDHGGDSMDEITAGMFVYSKKPLLSIGELPKSVKQVDLIPTISAILGIPIPFQNLGTVIFDCLPITSDLNDSLKKALIYLWNNVEQIVDYLKTTSISSNVIPDNIFNSYLQRYSSLKTEALSINNQDAFLRCDNKVREFLNGIRLVYEEAWVQFDTSLMNGGLFFACLSICFIFLITMGVSLRRLLAIFDRWPTRPLLAIVGTTFIITLFSNLSNNVFFASNIISQIFFTFLIIRHRKSLDFNLKFKKDKIVNVIYILIVFITLFIPFSNSFVNEESAIHLFFVVSIFFLVTINIASNLIEQNIKTSRNKLDINVRLIKKEKLFILATIFAAVVRLSVYFWRCRAEQDWCYEASGGAWFKLKSSKLQWAISTFSLVIFVFSTKQWLTHLGNLNGFSMGVVLMKFAPTVIVVSTSGYWVLEKMSGQDNLKTVNYLALSVYGLTFTGILTLFSRPLSVFMLPKNTQEENVIPQLFRKIKQYLVKTTENAQTPEEVPVVYGLGTVYSSAYLYLGVYLVLLFNLLLGVATGPSNMILFASLAFVLFITSLLRIRKATSVESLFDVPIACVLLWVIVTHYFFYATGHQPTFPNINWEAAFIGTSGIIRNNIVLGTLIIINTFCSNILMGMLLPLLVITPFTIFVVRPSLVSENEELLKSCARGELTLFEKEDLANASMFNLACKCIMAHALKVFATMLASTIHCRHLMVWGIFAPKLIFEVIGLCVTMVSVLLGYFLFYRITTQVECLVNKLSKAS